MKTSNFKKIYALLIIAILFIKTADAQIVYTDVNPDSSSTGTYKLDLNNDGITDFNITHSTGSTFCGHTSNYVRITPTGSNQVADSSNYAARISINNLIDASVQTWSSSQRTMGGIVWSGFNCSTVHVAHLGPFYNMQGFLGLKFIVNGNTYYGWVRTETSGGYGFTIFDYAYNSIPNQPILAGETTCTIPTVSLSVNGSLSFCVGDSVTLTANGTGYQYQWKKNNVNVTGATKQTYVAKTAGVYKCKVTNSCGSKTSGTRTVTIPCRISNENFVETLEHLSVYPNTATNSITIKFPSDEPGEISVANLFGQIVFSKKINSEQKIIDVSRFPTGMYVVRWNNGANNETKMFSVIK